jgi:hypothetical protein
LPDSTIVRLLATALLLGALFGGVGGAEAQVRVGVAGGPVYPLGDLGDVLERGYHGGVVFDAGLPLLPLSLHGEVMFQRNSASAGEDQDYRHLGGSLNARLDVLPIPLVAAYATGGVGWYLSDYHDDQTADASSWSSETGINAGVGVSVSLVVVQAFVEVRCLRVLSDPARTFAPLTVGVTLF